MKAEDMAPSPTISLSMLGMRKATKKASDRVPAPRVRAMTLSRMYPVTREVRVSGVMIEAERTRRWRASSASSAAMGFRILARIIHERLQPSRGSCPPDTSSDLLCDAPGIAVVGLPRPDEKSLAGTRRISATRNIGATAHSSLDEMHVFQLGVRESSGLEFAHERGGCFRPKDRRRSPAVAATALSPASDPSRLDRGQRDLSLLLHARYGVLLLDAAPAPDAGSADRHSFLCLRHDSREADDPHVEQAGEDRGTLHLHTRRRLRLLGHLHDVQGGDVEQSGDLAPARARDPAGPRRVHPAPARAHPPDAVPAPLRLGRSGHRVPRRDGPRRETREAPETDRQRQRRYGVLPFLFGDVRPGAPRRQEARRQRVLPVLPSRFLPPVAAFGAPFLLLQQPLLPQERGADGGPGRPRADQVVLGLP